MNKYTDDKPLYRKFMSKFDSKDGKFGKKTQRDREQEMLMLETTIDSNSCHSQMSQMSQLSRLSSMSGQSSLKMNSFSRLNTSSGYLDSKHGTKLKFSR